MREFESSKTGSEHAGEASRAGGAAPGKATLTESLAPAESTSAGEGGAGPEEALAGEGGAGPEEALAGDDAGGGGGGGGGGAGGGGTPPAAMVMSPVTINVTQAPIALSQRGSAEYKVQWAVGGGKNGWVIQHVRFRPAVQDAAGTPVAARNPSIEYWEGWQVRGGNVFVGSGAAAHKADTFRTISENANTKGTIQIVGKVAFIENYNLTEPPWGHTVAAAGALPTMTSAPDGWSGGGAQDHTMRVTYDDVAKTPQTQVGTP